MKKPWVLIVLAVLVLAGCTITKPIARQSMDFNLAFEKSKNQQILLNVVRSSLHLPTHYTAISQLLGAANNTFAPTLLSPFGGDAPSSYSLSLTNSTSAGISTVSMATLDSQTFVQGIMSPLSVDNFEYYQKQGWPQEMILLLFVRKLVYEGKEYLNEPSADFKDIERFLTKIRELKFSVRNESGQAVGPAFALGPNETLASLILQGKAAGLELAQVTDDTNKTGGARGTDTAKAGETKERPSGPNAVPNASKTEPAEADTSAEAEPAKSKNSPGASSKESGQTESTQYEFRKSAKSKVLYINETRSFSAHSQDHDHSADSNVIYFRSTDAIFAYLGGIMRYQDATHPKPKIRAMNAQGTAEEEVALFVADRAHKGNKDDAQVKAEHRGVHYVIPDTESVRHRSMDVLTILSQLISLHKSSTEIPSTGVVTVSGG